MIIFVFLKKRLVSYETIDNSRVVVSIDSTLGLEFWLGETEPQYSRIGAIFWDGMIGCLVGLVSILTMVLLVK